MNAIRVQRIVALDISQSHPNQKPYRTDAYYAKLANQLLDDFKSLRLDFGQQTSSIVRYTALLLANYMEDIVADSGQWRSFSVLSQQMLGQSVPMYHSAEAEYYPDEPSFEAVRFIVWHAATEMDDIWWNADDKWLRKMAEVAYARLVNAFEQIPISEELAEGINDMLGEAAEDFQKMRLALIWIFKNCYLIRSLAAEKLIEKRLEEAADMSKVMPPGPMRMFYAIMHSIFAYKIGPLALESKEYLAALMRTKLMLGEAQEVIDIEVKPMGYYRYTIEKDGQWLQMLRTNGERIRVARDEITLDDEALHRHDGCCAIFVKYLGAWHMNGIMIPAEGIAKHWDALVKKDPEYRAKGVRDLTGEMLLKQSGGKEILYFKNKEELKNYMIKNMRYSPDQFEFLSKHDLAREYPLIFIDKNAKKFAFHLSFGFVPCIADPANPYYDAAVARKEAIKMLWSSSGVSTEAVLYLLDHDYLPDIYDDALFSRESTPEEKRADVRFLLRYMRRENY
ncbi:MAG: DUF3843 family protein [Muribaculaceae bacterium]|nr:DUF3843 family protein [Muribaculaceae bacterium]